MGTALSGILVADEIDLGQLSGKRLVVDAYNQLYQYLSTIRQRDGTPLMDSKGNITSHLSGLFFRTVNLMENGTRLVFVFDGTPPQLKRDEINRRKELKEVAVQEYEKARLDGDVASMEKFAKRTARLSEAMVQEAKQLLDALGVPYVDAPSEAEAQAAHMVKSGDFYAVVSQDTDCLMFGAPKIVKNLAISPKKKLPGSPAHKKISPELIDLAKNMNLLGIDQDKLIALGMLVGTDFNIGGIKGVGPKKGLGLVQRYADMDQLFKEVGWSDHFRVPWTDVFYTIKRMPTIDVQVSYGSPSPAAVKQIMMKHEFSEERVDSALLKITKRQQQKGLGDFFS